MTHAELKKHFQYNKNTGVFTRINRKNSHGSVDAYGYLILKIKTKQYKAHRMAWLYFYKQMPDGEIDHINGDKLDNSIKNLRCVDRKTNCRNLTIKTNIDTGYKGVRIDRTNGLKKIFTTRVLGKTYRFYTAKKASEFRIKKLKQEKYGKRHF